MSFTTESRQLFLPPRECSVAVTGDDGSVQFSDSFRSSQMTPPGYQSTYGWRTGQTRTGSVYEEELSGEEMRKEIRRPKNQNGASDKGHPFNTKKQVWSYIAPNASLSSPRYPGAVEALWKYYGPVGFSVGSMYPTEARPLVLSDGLFKSLGAKQADGRKLIGATIPTAPEAGLATFLGELREGLPSITGMILLRSGSGAQSLSKAAASEYLNVQFGLIPFIADLKKMVVATLNTHKIFVQYLRDSKKHVRRKSGFPETITFDDPINSVGRVWLPTNPETGDSTVQQRVLGDEGRAQVSYTMKKSEKVSFSGCYQYAVEDGSSYLERARRYEQLANKLLGTRITPETIWELTPWSWLVDWVGDIGTQISNAVALSSDNLVLRYAYVMHHTMYEQTWHISGARDAGGHPIPPVEYRLLTQEKSRVQATPYGFGVSWDGFSLKQLSILAALGITRAPNIKS